MGTTTGQGRQPIAPRYRHHTGQGSKVAGTPTTAHLYMVGGHHLAACYPPTTTYHLPTTTGQHSTGAQHSPQPLPQRTPARAPHSPPGSTARTAQPCTAIAQRAGSTQWPQNTGLRRLLYHNTAWRATPTLCIACAAWARRGRGDRANGPARGCARVRCAVRHCSACHAVPCARGAGCQRREVGGWVCGVRLAVPRRVGRQGARGWAGGVGVCVSCGGGGVKNVIDRA